MKSWLSTSLVPMLLLIILISAGHADAQTLWATKGACGDASHSAYGFYEGEQLYINGSGFAPNTALAWTITGSDAYGCDGNAVIASGSITTDQNGAVCFFAYTIQKDDCGEYLVQLGSASKVFKVYRVPAIDLIKYTNNQDANGEDCVEVLVGSIVTWKYVITNTGSAPLKNLTLVDDQLGAITLPQNTLDLEESLTVEVSGVAVEGNYRNIATVTGRYEPHTGPADYQTVTDTDPSCYVGVIQQRPQIDIEKATNGQDADTPTGPSIPVGGTVTWTYVITNTGNVPLTAIAVVDDKIGAITLPKTTLAVGESMTATAGGTALAGQYANVASVQGVYEDTTVTDSDPSHYFGTTTNEPKIDIEKYVNDQDADTPTGPVVFEGDDVVWKYVVTNTGPVALINISVIDDKIGPVVMPKTTLTPGESMQALVHGTAEIGQYVNLGTVVGFYNQTQVIDQDPAHYLGQCKNSIQVLVFTDTNGNGSRDAGEPAIPGVNIRLDGPEGSDSEKMTDGNGFAAFNNLPIGHFEIHAEIEGASPNPQSVDLECSSARILVPVRPGGGGCCEIHFYGYDPEPHFNFDAPLLQRYALPAPSLQEQQTLQAAILESDAFVVILRTAQDTLAAQEHLQQSLHLLHLGVDHQVIIQLDVSTDLTDPDLLLRLGFLKRALAHVRYYDYEAHRLRVHVFSHEDVQLFRRLLDELAPLYLPAGLVYSYNWSEAAMAVDLSGYTDAYAYPWAKCTGIPFTGDPDQDAELLMQHLQKFVDSGVARINTVFTLGQNASPEQRLAFFLRTWEFARQHPTCIKLFWGYNFYSFAENDGPTVVAESSDDLRDQMPDTTLYMLKQENLCENAEHLPIAIDLTRLVLKARQAMADSNKVEFAITQLLAKDYEGAEATIKEPIAQRQQEREFTLTFTGQGSNCWNDQDWTNAVDGDLDGWDGTVTARGNDAGNNYRDPAWAVFSLQNTATLNAVAIQTDNGVGDVYTPNRWATHIEILASMDGVRYTTVAKIQRERRVQGELKYYRLASDIQANYLKLVIHAPNSTNQAWRQLVEFKALYTQSVRLEKTVDAFAAEPETVAPTAFTLEQNYPNPFNPSTTIGFVLPEQETVQMVIYDLAGRTVNVLVDGTMPAGRHQVIWEGTDASGSQMPSGIYLCRLAGRTQIRTIKLMMVK